MEKEPKPIRILFTIPNFDTAGSGKALLNIATRLDKNKFEPHIMCMHDRGDFFQVVKDSGIPVHILDYSTPMRPMIKGLRQCCKISRKFRKINPDIIHSFHYAADYSEPLAARLSGIKWIYTKKSMSWGGSSRNGWKLRTALAQGIIAQNSDMLKQFFPGKKNVVLIPRGVDVQRFAPGSRDESLRQRYGVQAHERIIICVANLVPVKGVEILIEAFARLVNDFQEWKIWIVGDDRGDYGDQLKALVQERGLSTRVIFTGKQPDVKPFLDQAEIFVLPTRQEGRMEGSPVSLLEAMANGKVVIGSDVPGIRDQLMEFKDYKFEWNNVDELTDTLYRGMQHHNLKGLGQTFLEFCKRNFSIEVEVKKHQLLYERICK
jgi:glycosyltransferase involved in cell wall biosynthesis